MNDEKLIVDEQYSNYALESFFLINYWVCQNGIILSKEDYENIFEHLHTNPSFDSNFFHTSREVQLYCLKYSLLGEGNAELVKKILEKRFDNVDIILNKYTKCSHKQTYQYLLLKYMDNENRIIQILNFKDYRMMVLCLNIVFYFDFSEDYVSSKVETEYLRLLESIPVILVKEVKELLQQNRFDEFLLLLQDVEPIKEVLITSEETLTRYALPWENAIMTFIERRTNGTRFFNQIVEEKGIPINSKKLNDWLNFDLNERSEEFLEIYNNDFTFKNKCLDFYVQFRELYNLLCESIKRDYEMYYVKKYLDDGFETGEEKAQGDKHYDIVNILKKMIYMLWNCWEYTKVFSKEDLYMIINIVKLAKSEGIRYARNIYLEEEYQKIYRNYTNSR